MWETKKRLSTSEDGENCGEELLWWGVLIKKFDVLREERDRGFAFVNLFGQAHSMLIKKF